MNSKPSSKPIWRTCRLGCLRVWRSGPRAGRGPGPLDHLSRLLMGWHPMAARAAAAPAAPAPDLKGTYFYPGAGMKGDYIAAMQAELERAGISQVSVIRRDRWSTGSELGDLALCPALRHRFNRVAAPDRADFSGSGRQFNLIGYSFGSLAAAQDAYAHAQAGGKVDHLVLIGSPISPAFLGQLHDHPNIGKVRVIDLALFGDPIHPHLRGWRLAGAMGLLAWQYHRGTGHFQFSSACVLGRRRQRVLARGLRRAGLA